MTLLLLATSTDANAADLRLASFGGVALLLFFGVFVAVALRTLLASRTQVEHARRMPLDSSERGVHVDSSPRGVQLDDHRTETQP